MRALIYGAGVYGTLVKKILDYAKIEIYAFIDRKLAGTYIEGIPVVAPEKIEEYRDCKIYIATKNYYSEIKRYLLDSGCENVSDIADILETDISKLQLSREEKDVWMQRKAYKIAVDMDKKVGNKFVHIEAVVTERCSLKCKDCSSLMPFYQNPCNVEVSDLIRWIKNLLSGVSYIGELRILGGEPFLNPRLTELITAFAENEKIGMLTIYTNGTVLPGNDILQCIRENNVLLHISDYGIGEKKREILVQKCEELQIDYVVRKYDEWHEFGPFIENNMPSAGLEKMYQNCISANCYTVLNGRLYHCPRAAHAEKIGLLAKCENDCLNLEAEIMDSELIKNFISDAKYIDACRYCYGTRNSDRLVQAAVQMRNEIG